MLPCPASCSVREKKTARHFADKRGQNQWVIDALTVGPQLVSTRQQGHRAKACYGWLCERTGWKRDARNLSRGQPNQGTINSIFHALPKGMLRVKRKLGILIRGGTGEGQTPILLLMEMQVLKRTLDYLSS